MYTSTSVSFALLKDHISHLIEIMGSQEMSLQEIRNQIANQDMSASPHQVPDNTVASMFSAMMRRMDTLDTKLNCLLAKGGEGKGSDIVARSVRPPSYNSSVDPRQMYPHLGQ